MRILGVDPGSRRTGWGLVGGAPARPVLIDCGILRPSESASFSKRLHGLRVEFERLVRRCGPSAAAVEAPFHGINTRSALQLAHARGVLLAVLGGEGIEVVEYTPAAVKKAVTGNGSADKRQVQSMIERLLGLRGGEGPPDVSDALGVAYCHAATLGLRGALLRSKTRERRRAAPRPGRSGV